MNCDFLNVAVQLSLVVLYFLLQTEVFTTQFGYLLFQLVVSRLLDCFKLFLELFLLLLPQGLLLFQLAIEELAFLCMASVELIAGALQQAYLFFFAG